MNYLDAPITYAELGGCADCTADATCTYRDVPLCTDCANHMAAQYDVCAVDGDDAHAIDDDESREVA